MAALIERIGRHRPRRTADPFRALIGSITQQQVSMAAAASIQRRLFEACPGGRPTPDAILRLRPARLRSIGLSSSKVIYIRGVAAAFSDGTLTARSLRRMTDEQVVEATTALKGIGRWTAEMLLMFCLERPDVWPVDDLGLRKAVRNHLGLGDMPARPVTEAAGEPFRPFRSYASWYLWRSLEGPLMPGVSLD